ncbi:MAG TPA: tRNA (adenosine(37)-N6)-threonylcarbamoyltransferase complex ATPase subunit type 1 TsaE [Kofleriaceae bacterium]|jgi:tRNA threonylcarbamoyladenosine biosynthesis protein TsaE|nr:tRNA (adenosine(37)-N6)-threonylcarbamoyltransferase complex ATPase subunit type 1 TsaE [Kofleriaceae bacterium]
MNLPDLAATVHAGVRLAGLVRGGDAIALVGDLGTGKTTLVTGLVAALGGGTAASPTFSLVNEYPGGRLVVWHVDLYRIERAAELAELGLDDMIGDPRGICVIEWADRFAVLPADHLQIELAHPTGGGGGRTLMASGTGPRGRALAALLLGST